MVGVRRAQRCEAGCLDVSATLFRRLLLLRALFLRLLHRHTSLSFRSIAAVLRSNRLSGPGTSLMMSACGAMPKRCSSSQALAFELIVTSQMADPSIGRSSTVCIITHQLGSCCCPLLLLQVALLCGRRRRRVQREQVLDDDLRQSRHRQTFLKVERSASEPSPPSRSYAALAWSKCR